MLTYDNLYKNSTLQCQGFYPDNAEKMNDTNVNPNTGWLARRNWFFHNAPAIPTPNHRKKELWGKILHPLVNCDVPVPPGVQVYLRLDVASDKFVLQQVI